MATWVGDTAQNYNNECREVEGWGKRERRGGRNERDTERVLRNDSVGRITRKRRVL